MLDVNHPEFEGIAYRIRRATDAMDSTALAAAKIELFKLVRLPRAEKETERDDESD